MKICIVVDDYLPDSAKVAAKMMHELAVEFRLRDHEVTVLTPGKNLTSPFQINEFDQVKVIRFDSGPLKNISKLKRLINEILLPIKCWKALENYLTVNSHDYILYYSPSIFWFGLIRKLKKKWKAPSYLILRDLFPQWVIDAGLIGEFSPIAIFLRYCERQNYKVADTIAVQSPRNKSWFSKKYKEFKNVQVLYNWSSASKIQSASGLYRKKLNLENKVVFFYGGNIGQAQDMRTILRLAKRFESIPKAHFLLVGAGDEFELIKKAIKFENISNLTLLDSVSQDQYREMLSEFDIGLFTLSLKHKTHNFPGKILEYMCQGKPVLGSVNPGNDLQEIINIAKAGFVSVTGDDDFFYQNALQLMDPDVREACGRNGEALLKKTFSVNSAVNSILKEYENLTNK
ncbi:glycosyltransferase family 4 protein [Leptospira sp. 201903070]|uniref:Glycosyltransferase family 4 protein n=1 Tax=Leptospira ainlahdjerensis TaxID=2810033 RepID=A0ABS2UA81_9LEPT|nr:glycosyltransferase family 4 protein [Leptospira ainlahdjerensis]MBM9577285.1 glycosyltransferase family 4 protein [Leptospira ainlahdjerensis]